MLEIQIDERENDLYAEIMKIPCTVPIVKCVLPLGDVLFRKIPEPTESKPVLLFERKSLTDLLASITDGRYKEQSFRLLNAEDSPAPHNVVYLIEGLISSIKNPKQKQKIYSAMTSLQFFKGMSVLRTWSVKETAELVVAMAEKIVKEWEKNPPSKQPAGQEEETATEPQYSLVGGTKKIKSENLTKDNIGEIMLCQIPKISPHSAQAILQKFDNSIAELIQTLRENPDDERFKNIYFIPKIANSSSKPRKINKVCVENLRKFLV
jgi:ERCC4-type nuclease